MPPAASHEALPARGRRAAIESTWPSGPVLVRVGVVVGQREAAGSRTGRARPGRRPRSRCAGRARPAGRAGCGSRSGARRRGRRRTARAGPRRRAGTGSRFSEPGERRLARDLVAVAAAVDEEGRARGADVGVVERLEHRLHVGRQVREVHVVDRVRQRAVDPEGAAGGERRPVLDVALLAPVVPVHVRDQVLVLGGAGGDGRGAHRGDRGEGGDAVVDVDAVLDEAGDGGRALLLDGALEHRRRDAVDHAEDELLHLVSERRPAYFSPARLRPPIHSQAKKPMMRIDTGGMRIARAAAASEPPSA